jgi:hypothetical protein
VFVQAAKSTSVFFCCWPEAESTDPLPSPSVTFLPSGEDDGTKSKAKIFIKETFKMIKTYWTRFVFGLSRVCFVLLSC